MDPVRLVTLHPAIVHVTIGTLPLIVVAYTLAARRSSERWAFVGDAALVTCAIAAVLGAVTGVISFVRLDWVGATAGWRWLHLGLGIAAAVLLAALAIVRLRRRGTSSWRTLAASAGIAVVTGSAGWIGGEVLVFRGGAGVIAAADGALAPPVGSSAARDVVEVMDRLRERWAEITTDTASMIAVAPAPARFARIARDADQLHALSGTLGRVLGTNDDTTQLATELGARAQQLAAAARAGDLERISDELGKAAVPCVRCHDQMR